MTTAQNRRIAAATCNSLSDLCLATPPPTVCKSANYRQKRRIPLPLSLPLFFFAYEEENLARTEENSSSSIQQTGFVATSNRICCDVKQDLLRRQTCLL
jgi:hypothetical protein